MSKYLKLLAKGILGALFLAFALDSTHAEAAGAEKRVALVIGESAYRNVPRLPNPEKDAAAIAKLFKDAGFDTVIAAYNVGNLDFKRALRKFEDAAYNSDIAVVYYAGHGIEVEGTNYLIPTDAKLASDRDAPDEAISLNRVLQSVDGARRLRLIILDACRDNPFLLAMRRLRREIVTRAIGGARAGLSAVEPAGSNTLIAYAAKAGQTALDGTGQHSPFTSALLDNLTIPGLDVRLAFGRVRDEVLKLTDHHQLPFVYGSLGGGNVALVPAPERPKPASTAKVKADYELVAQVGTPQAWQVFLGTYKTGFYSDLAKAQLAKLQKLAKLEPPPRPEPPQPTTDEVRAWNKVKDATDKDALKSFISRYPNSPLALNAQHRLDILERAARQRAEKARAARDAARQRAAKEQRAKEAAEAARVAAQMRAAEAQRAQEAARIAAEQKAEDERRAKETARIAALKAENARRTKEVTQSEQRRNEQAAHIAALQAEIDRRAKQLAETETRNKDLACKREQARLDDLDGAGVSASVRDDMKRLADDLTCESLRPRVVASLEKITGALNKPKPAKIAVPLPTDKPEIPTANTPALVTSAQKQLARLGCYQGDDNGVLNPATKLAIKKYEAKKGRSATDSDIAVTDDFVDQLSNEKLRVCPAVVVDRPPPEEQQKAERHTNERKAEKRTRDRKAERRARERERDRRAARRHERSRSKAAHSRPRPRASRQARAGGGGGGGHATMIGVGF